MKKLVFSLILTAITFAGLGQSELTVFPDWLSTTGSQNFFYKNVTKVDGSGNIYIAGATVNGSGNYDMLVAKYSSRGEQLWIQQYNGAANGNDIAAGLFIDDNGNVYITGAVTTSTDIEIITIKYNNIGTQQWLETYNGNNGFISCGSDVAVGGSGHVYVTGSSLNANGNYDMFIIKYDDSGIMQWGNYYDSPYEMNDISAKLLMNGSSITISGIIQCNSSSFTYAILEFDAGDGTFNNEKLGDPVTTAIDQIADVVQDAAGNIYVAGSAPVSGQGYDFDIIKLSYVDLSLEWEQTYDAGDGLDDIAKGIKVSSSGKIYVTGTSETSSERKNMITIKYFSDGTLDWTKKYNGLLDYDDEAYAMALDQNGNIYVTGCTATEIDSADYFTMKYDPSGNLLWTIHNDGDAHLNDKATNIAIDDNGDVIVTGESETAPGEYEYCTVKYVERQIITPTDYNEEEPQGSFMYYQNKGQIIDTDGDPVSSIKYYVNNSSPEFYIKKNSFSFVFAKVDTSASTDDTLHRIDVAFKESASSTAKVYAMEEQPSYLNYFLGHCPEGITEVHGNERLITYGLYSNIDLMYSSNQDGIKYYFIVKPGGNPANIIWDIAGASSFNINGSTNDFTINSSIGSLTFERPTAYQLSSTNTIIPITGWQCAWQTYGATGHEFNFYTGSYDNTKALIIQVDRGHSTQTFVNTENIEWSTFYGGDNDDILYDVTNDNVGNIYVTGYSWSNNFPIIIGPYTQMQNNGNYDAVILAFHPYGIPTWATYYGGNGGDMGTDIAADTKGNIFITGITSLNSSSTQTDNTFPVINLAGAYNHDPILGPDYAIIVKLKQSNGKATWATAFGDDYTTGSYCRGYSIKCDNDNNIYIGGSAIRITNFPIVDPGTSCTEYMQSPFNINMGFIAKFDNIYYNIYWSTLFGNDNCVVRDMAITSSKSLFITGYTSNLNTSIFPNVDVTGNHYNQSNGGGSKDAFIAEFNNCHEIQWGTFFGGDDNDYSYGICLSGDNIFIVGKTNSDENSSVPFPIVDNNNSSSLNIDAINGNYDGFITRFDRAGDLVWSTYFGGTDDDVLNKICLNGNYNLFIIGSTASDAIDMPPNSLQDVYQQNILENCTTGVHCDACILGFGNDLDFLWSTYFGGEAYASSNFFSDDFGWGISSYSTNKLYIVGEARGFEDFPLFDNRPTYSSYFQGTIMTNPNVDHPGYADGFITQFGLSGTILSNDENYNDDSDILIMPNPNNGIFEILFSNFQNMNGKIEIYDMLGKLVFSDFVISNSSLHKKIEIHDLNKGMYFLRLNCSDLFCVKKFIIN